MQESLAGSLHEVVGLLDRSGEVVLQREAGVSYRQFYLVSAINRLGPATQRELADFVGHSDAAISRMVTVLANAGLLTAQVDPANRRRNIVALTAKGADLAQRAETLLDQKLTELLKLHSVDATAYLSLTLEVKHALHSAGWDPRRVQLEAER